MELGDSLITSAASFNLREAFISPSAAITLARASRAASASAAIALCSWIGRRTSLISTRSTLIPHGSVASSKVDCIPALMYSRSVRTSDRFLVPSMFLNVGNAHCSILDSVVDNSVYGDGNAVLGQNLL